MPTEAAARPDGQPGDVRRRPWEPLQSRNYRFFAACDVISALGSAVSFIALPFAVLRIGGSATDVGLVATAETVPFAAFLLHGGVIADRLPRQRVMVAATVAQAIAQAAAAGLVIAGLAQVWELMALAAAASIGAGFFYPAAQGLLPQTVPRAQRQQANALLQTGSSLATIGGSALGGLLVGAAGPGWGLEIDAMSFAVAAALRAGMRLPALPAVEPAAMIQDLREGWREFTSRRWLWVLSLQMAVIVAVSTATADVLGPLVADSRLGGARSWGLVIATFSIGAIVAGLVLTQLQPDRLLLTAVVAVPAFSLLLFALAVPLAVPLDTGAAFLAGVSVGVWGVCWATAIQREIPADKLSRVSSYNALGMRGLAPLGTAIAGPLATAFGTSAVLAVSGALVVLIPVLALLLLPEIRQMQPRVAPAGSRHHAGWRRVWDSNPR
jgi:MFS family permease